MFSGWAGESDGRSAIRVAGRIGVVAGILGLSSWVLFSVFDGLDILEITVALSRLSEAEWLALAAGWLVWVVAQGWLTASLVSGLSVRRGVLASLGPTAVSSVIPGPSDLPVRYSMYQSWGVSSSDAATALGTSGIFSIGSQLLLPAVAGVILVLSDVSLGGVLPLVVAASLVLAVLVALSVFLVGSSRRVESIGRWLDGPFQKILRRAGRPVPDRNLGFMLVARRAIWIDYLGDKWLTTTTATAVTHLAKCGVLVMALRFVGLPEDALGALAIFAVYGLVVAGLTAVSLTPGSVGVTEIGFVGLLTAAAGSPWVNEITAGVLLYRLMTWLLLIPVGFGALGVWRLRLSR